MANNIFYDKEFRDKVRGLDEESLAQLMADSAGDTEVKVLTNSKSTTYFVIPTNQGDWEQLNSIQAGKFNTIGCVGTVSTWACVCSCLGSVGSAASLGCAGT